MKETKKEDKNRSLTKKTVLERVTIALDAIEELLKNGILFLCK